MWAAYDDNKKEIVAFHDEKRVVKCYISNIEKNYKDISLSLLKLPNKKCRNLQNFDDLYLVRYEDTYVQNRYYVYQEILTGGSIYENRLVKEILERSLGSYDFSKKELKTIIKTIKIFDKILADDISFVMSYEDLKKSEMDYYPYIYNLNKDEIKNQEE
jgi:hypothetical protein